MHLGVVTKDALDMQIVSNTDSRKKDFCPEYGGIKCIRSAVLQELVYAVSNTEINYSCVMLRCSCSVGRVWRQAARGTNKE